MSSARGRCESPRAQTREARSTISADSRAKSWRLPSKNASDGRFSPQSHPAFSHSLQTFFVPRPLLLNDGQKQTSGLVLQRNILELLLIILIITIIIIISDTRQ